MVAPIDLQCLLCAEREDIEVMYGYAGRVAHVRCKACGHLSFFQRPRVDAHLGGVEDAAS